MFFFFLFCLPYFICQTSLPCHHYCF
jgi:hypothetical protein